MLRHILDACRLPAGVEVCFCNTGKERSETLDFVHECGQRWGIPIVWLEYHRKMLPVYKSAARSIAATRARAADQSEDEYVLAGKMDRADDPGFRVVDYATASRNGEPFENLIEVHSLPNIVTRMCTAEMKVRVIKKYMMGLGHREWENVVGIRADEPLRVARMRAQVGNRWTNSMPLAVANVSETDVLAFWKAQPFDLRLRSYEGNCDLCFLKGAGKRRRIMREQPELAAWWIHQEERTGATFRIHSDTYRRLFDDVQKTPEFDFGDACASGDDLGDCFCGD